jgi:putative membrane protein insertion efficiency factor
VSLVSRLLTLLVRAYQLVVRPILPPACRFVPSCSDYAIEALREHGAWRGLVLAGWRLLRCNPFSAGGYDPVPATRPERQSHAACHGAGCSPKKRI